MADDFARQLLDALYNPETQPPQQPSRPLREKLAGAAETAATIGTGLLGSVPAGLAGLTQLIPTRGHRPSVNRAAQKVEDVQSALTYLPRTEAGQEYLEKTAGALGVLGMPAEFLGEQTLKLTGSPFLATTANVVLDPVNYIGMPGSGRAIVAGTKAVGRGAMQAGRAMAQDPAVGAAVERAIQRVAPAAMPMYAVKPKGGNWLAGEVEGATEPLKRNIGEIPLSDLERGWAEAGVADSEGARNIRAMRAPDEAINNWIDKKLNRYIRNEMATPEDPVRKLAEQGILHYEPRVTESFSGYAAARRRGEGEQLGVAPLAKVWEDVSDVSIIPSVAEDLQSGDYKNLKMQNPWIDKVSPETKIYGTSSTSADDLGFSHLIDELKNSIRPDSDLPAHLRWKPEDLEKVTMEQAVRRVHDINEYRAQKKAEANEVLARNPATVTFKEYPAVPGSDKPNEKGLAWKEIRQPEFTSIDQMTPEAQSRYQMYLNTGVGEEAALRQAAKHDKSLAEALKYEGDVMGHCVGGYCDDVLSGKTQIFTLRDKKGEPHVTIEVRPYPKHDSDFVFYELQDKLGRNPTQEEWDAALSAKPPEIIQIKGKANRAPKDEYLPFVQDFVRNGNWSRVGDFQNTGLRDMERTPNLREWLRSKGIETPRYVTEQEYGKYEGDFLLDRLGKKEGGSVHISDNPDTMALELAGGGGVGEDRDWRSKIAGGGIRGIITRGLLGMDPPEDMTPREREVYENAVRASAPALGLAAAPAAIIKSAKGAKAAKPVYPQAEALERARQNAVKMLNLPENNTPEMRAQAMGYIDYLHGTQRLDRLLEGKTLDPRRATSGPMPYGTTTPELASSYATSKADTSRRATDEGDVRRYFEVAPKDIGIQGLRSPLPVETAWHFMSPEQQAKIRELAPRVGYENLDEFTGNLIVHPEGVNGNLSANHWNWLMKNEAKGNPLTALRHMWYESGQLVHEPETLGQIYRLAGVDAPISQTKAPWTEAQGVLLGKARITNPIDTSNTEQVSALIEPLKQAFARDRSRTKAAGPDQWAKDVRYTPRSWVSELEKDLAEGKESYVWTSIPDKVTAELRRLGFNGIIDRSGKGGGAKEPVVIPFDPAQVRSRFAAFDPAEMDVPDLLKATGGIIKAAVKAVKPTAEQAAKMAEQRAELVLRSRAMQELKDQFENLPQPPKGFLSSESILQRMDEIRRREATPSGEQIPLLKKGGAVEMQAGGALKAAAKAAERAAKAAKPDVLPAAEREANLKKMLKSSHVKRPVYHGTNKTDTLADESGQAIRQFDSYVNWFTQDPYHASGYATQDGRQIEGAATYPAYLSLQRPLHLRGDLNDKTTYAQFRKETGLDVRPGPYEDEVVDGVEQMIPRWWITNSPSFADAARAAGFDGVIANEGGTKTFGVFYHEPGKIKSAIGNRGTFDVTNPDITKKRGGSVKFTDNLDTMRLAVQKRK